MLRIEITENNGAGVTLRLTGRLIGPWVDELERSCDEVLGTGARLQLDFADVSFVDGRGGRLVSRLRGAATIVGCSPFVTEQLRAWQDEPRAL